jgi:hypothetical protein
MLFIKFDGNRNRRAVTGQWHQGEDYPIAADEFPRVVTFQADGDELEILLDALKKCSKRSTPRESFLPTNAAIAEQIRAAMNETKVNAERMFGGMLAELVEARAILHELLPYCRTHVNQESFRDAINRAERLLTPKTKGGTP